MGDDVGDLVGYLVGDFVGLRVGDLVGDFVGARVGDFVGNSVGAGDTLGGAVIGGTVSEGISMRLLPVFTLGFFLVVPSDVSPRIILCGRGRRWVH